MNYCEHREQIFEVSDIKKGYFGNRQRSLGFSIIVKCSDCNTKREVSRVSMAMYDKEFIVEVRERMIEFYCS